MPYISYMPIRTIQTIQAIHAYTIKYISLHTNSYNTYHTYQYILYIHIHTYTYQYIQYIPYIPIHAIRTDTCQYLPIPALMNTYRYMPYVPIHTNTCNTYHCQYVHQYVPSWYIPIRTKIHAKIHTHTYQYIFTDSIRANTSIAHPWWMFHMQSVKFLKPFSWAEPAWLFRRIAHCRHSGGQCQFPFSYQHQLLPECSCLLLQVA